MAWMRMMGRESVEYHRRTVIDRGDDYPGRALAYYASRGETPLLWDGSGAERLGLAGPVTADEYEAVYGPGGARHPMSGERLVVSRRPGLELVISAHKSVAELGVIGRAEHIHQIMDAERDATLDYLDRITRQMGGRRGRAATPTATGGLVYAHTRHATSRAGDPNPHDHVMIANVVKMADEAGGWKAADTALWREHLHAATMVGRVAAAQVAVELGYGIEADTGPSGKLRHWRIAGIPDEVLAVHSKRSAEIEAECARRGESSYQARGVAARTTRSAKQHGPVESDLVWHWQGELLDIGWEVDRLEASVDNAARRHGVPKRLTRKQARKILSEMLGPDSELARRKVFCRCDVIVAIAPYLYGQDPAFLEAMVDRALADPEAIPLVGVAGARQQPYSLASVIARETAIADTLARQLDRNDAPATPTGAVTAAIADVEAGLGGQLSPEQATAAVSICASGRGVELVVGVAGAGKTTMLRVVATAYQQSGYQVVGTATSGQAAKNLGTEAELGESRTLASLIWRIDHDQLRLDDRSVVLCDEVGMTDDIDLLRLATQVEGVGAKLVLIGDHRQLGAVGPGGALHGLVGRHPDSVHYLMENRRQHNAGERRALSELRDGQVAAAVDWYKRHGRLHAIETRDDAVQSAVDAWAEDVAAGQHTALYAWRRANVAALNDRARKWMETSGRLSGPEVVCPGGFAYRAGDQVVTLAPGPNGTLVTSQRAAVVAVDAPAAAILVRTPDDRVVRLAGEEASAERLGYGYATTVHRAQGATVGRAHLLADGGGRELGYVAMSRARESTHVWVVADDAGQAVDDLARDWSTRRSPTWAIDTGQPVIRQSESTPTVAPRRESDVRTVALTKAHAEVAEAGFVFVRPPAWNSAIDQARRALHQARQAKVDLAAGAGVYRDTEPGRAVRDLRQAQGEVDWARQQARQAPGWRDRRTASKQAAVWAERQAVAIGRWHTQVAPEDARLDHHIQRLDHMVGELVARAEQQRGAQRAIEDRALQDRHQGIQLARTVRLFQDHLDEIPPPVAETVAPVVRHELYLHSPVIEPPSPQISIGR